MRKIKNDIDIITDVFTGADGGRDFINFLVMMDQIEKQANDGDEASEKILEIVRKFARLVKVNQ